MNSGSTAVPTRADPWSWTQQHLELFTSLYLQHEVLLQPATVISKKVTQERLAALRSLGAALEPGLEPLVYRTRSIIYMYRSLCRTELRALIAAERQLRGRGPDVSPAGVMQRAPQWLRQAEGKLHMLPQLLAEKNKPSAVVKPNAVIHPNVVTKPPHAPRSSCLLALASLARASRGNLPSTARTDRLVALWDRLRHMSLHKLLRLRRRECDTLWQHEWLTVDVVLLYDNSYSLITEETFLLPSQVLDLERLLDALPRVRARARGGWLYARAAFHDQRGYVSLVLLQRLWSELREHARRAMRGQEYCTSEALRLHKKVAGMFPGLLTDPAPAWRDLVPAGLVHEDQYDVGEDKDVNVEECEQVLDELMERDKDDDIILIEREIETVELFESSDEESSTVIDRDKAPGESETDAPMSRERALERLEVVQSRGDNQEQVENPQCPARSITSRNESVESKETDDQTEIEDDNDGDGVEKSSLVTEQSSIALLEKLNPTICKTVLIFEDDDSSDEENVAELNKEKPIDDNITKDNTDIIERALKVVEPVTPTKIDIFNTSTNKNYSDSDNLVTDDVKTLNENTISFIKENIPDDSVSKYFKTNYNETKLTATLANYSDNGNTVINETISLNSQTTPAIPDYVSIDNIATTSDSQTTIISPKANDNDCQITKRIKSNVIPADIAREIQMKKDIKEKNYQYKRTLQKQDIAIDTRMKKLIKSLDDETNISVLQAEIANGKAKGIIPNDDAMPANDNYNIVISDVKSLVNRNKISNRSLLKPNIAKMTNCNELQNSNHIIEHSYSQNAECDPNDVSQQNLITNDKNHTINNDSDSDDSCELVIEESVSRLKQTDSPIEQGDSQRQSDSQIDIKPTATLNEQKTEYDALKYFKYKQSNKSSLMSSKTIVSFENIIPWIRPLNRVIKSEKSGSSVKQSDSCDEQSGSGVGMSSSAGDSDDAACSDHSFGSNGSDMEFDIDAKLLQTVSVPLVRCDYLLSLSHYPNPTPSHFNLTDRHEANDPKSHKNPLSKDNNFRQTPYETDTSDSENDDLVIDSDADLESSDKTVLYSSDVTRVRGKNGREIHYNTREKETARGETGNTYFDVAWRNLSADFIMNRRNIELLALCRPLSVVLERLSSVGGREWGDGGEGRRQKRVRLADIEEVRRVNSSLQTAQVAPIAADPAGGGADTALLSLKQCLEQPQRRPNFADQLQNLQKHQENILTREQQERQRLEQEKQRRFEAERSGQQRLREGSKYCCAAKRHRALNDARNRMYRGNNLAPPRELPLHDFSHKTQNKCMCCCTHLLVKPVQNKPKVKPGPKCKKPQQSKEKEKKRKKSKPTSKSKSRSKSKLKRQKKIIPTLEEIDEKLKNDLDEWNRQKTLNQKYFYISSMMTDKHKTTPKDNVTPIDNTTPKENASPKNNTTTIDNDTSRDNATSKDNATPIEKPKDNATEGASDQPQVTTAPVSHLFHTQTIPIHNKYINQRTVKLCMNLTNGQTDKPVNRPATNTPTLGNPSNDKNIEKPVANLTLKQPPALLPLRVRSDLCAANQPTTFVNQPATHVNQPSSCVNQPSIIKIQPASFKNQTASFVNPPTPYVYQPSTFVKQPVTLNNEPVTFLHQHVTTINQPKKNVNQPSSTNQSVTPVIQLHQTLVPVAFKMLPSKAYTQKFVKIAPKPPPPEKLNPKTWKVLPTDTILEKKLCNTKENVKSTDSELNQPDGSLLQHIMLSKDTLEHRDAKDMPLTEQKLIQPALDDVVTSMESETEMKKPAIKSVTSRRRRASCDVIDAVAPKRRASDVINYVSSELTIRPVDKPGPPKFTLEPNKITIKPLTMKEKPRDVTIRSLEVAGPHEVTKQPQVVTNSSNEVKIKIESSELAKEENSDIEPVLKENSSIMSELRKTLLNSVSSKDTGKADDDVAHKIEGKDKDSEIPNVVIKKEEDKSSASIEDSTGQNKDTMGNCENMGKSRDSIDQSGDAIRPSDAIGSSQVNIEPIEDTKEQSNEYALWSSDYMEPTDYMEPNEYATETSEINMGRREVNVGPSEYTLVSNEHGLWSSDDAMGQSEDSSGPSGGNTGQSEVIMEPNVTAHSKDTKGSSKVRTEECIDITEDSSNEVAEVSSEGGVTCTGATNVTKASNVTSQIRVVFKTIEVPTTMTIGVTSQTLNAGDIWKGPTSFTNVVTNLRVHIDSQSTNVSTSSGTPSKVAASKVVESAPSKVRSDAMRSSDSSDVEEISETGPPPQLPPLSYRVGQLHMLPPVRARDLVAGRDPTRLSVHRLDLSRDLLLLTRAHLLLTEHDIPCRDPTYFYIGPRNVARMIIFEDDVRPPSVKSNKNKSKIQVKDFARVEAGNAYNSISVGGAAVPAETASSTDILLGAAPDRLTAGTGNLFQKITNEPLVYAQVHTVVQSLRRARHLLLQHAPLAVLSTSSGLTHPLLRDVTLRPVGLSCALPGALHDLVDRLNAQSNEAIAQRSMNSITVHDSDED